MVANLSLNQFEPNTPVDGMYVYQANLPQLHNVIVSSSQSNALKAGDIVVLDTASTNTNAPVCLGADIDEVPFGVVTYTPMTNAFVAGERVGIARENDIIWKTADSAIAVGDVVGFKSDYTVETASPGSGNTAGILGIALTPASAKGDLIQVQLKFSSVTGS